MTVPRTSTTMLRQLAADSQHVRWAEFVARYRPMMEAYLRAHYPVLDADEVVAETLIALVEALKGYRYAPDETGVFHNYLTGVLRHRALRLCRREQRQMELRKRMAAEPEASPEDAEEVRFRESLLEVAVRQFFADESVAPRTKEIFRRTAMKGESPEAVAKSFMMERNAVDQSKNRSIAKLRKLVAALERVDD